MAKVKLKVHYNIAGACTNELDTEIHSEHKCVHQKFTDIRFSSDIICRSQVTEGWVWGRGVGVDVGGANCTTGH